MGCCYSSESDYSRHQRTSANVVSVTGELRLYPLPITVSEVLQLETSSPNSIFLCNSDLLYFDDYIPTLEANEELEPAQIYFVLPISKLESRLAASDMAALAVKASVALNASTLTNKSARISPVLTASEDPESTHRIPIKKNSYINKNARNVSGRSELGVSRSSAVRRLQQRHSSRRPKLAVSSFKLKLTTVNEGTVLLN
ncbi:hypothetical protein ACS0TY_023718 [Phlomoides rotata]